jgi:hypothetical protein
VDTRTSPTTGNRDIEVEAFYGNTGSNAADCTLSVRRDPGTGWATATQTAKLTASDGAADDELGSSVAISSDGSTVVAGAVLAKREPGSGLRVREAAGDADANGQRHGQQQHL